MHRQHHGPLPAATRASNLINLSPYVFYWS